MIVLGIRTDKPEAGLYLYVDAVCKDTEVWQAHRQLAETIHMKIEDLLERNGENLQAVQGLVCFQGPGSFTGLRIGLTVANTLAYALGVPIVAAQGEDWAEQATQRLEAGENDQLAMPFYGADAHITPQKK
ncbi:tRNA (adenosine(37)-N6)-threonylcarbamoyltransferase complex dimerization subunit type 1 TsaB [Candidatus Saccharibacteria bacterium]|nr:MAG: tRNA (adenosine(37)-N6)-threonylcarbamoyltransferase complex dimerization subunit type 1 TsaB [Candidatus Saccharibacteria bacterium]